MDSDDQARLRGDMARAANVAARALAFDPERYRHHLAHLDMSESAQAELLAVIWRIMESAVDRAFGEDATQLARIAGDKRAGTRDRRARSEVSSDHPTHDDDETLADVFRLCGESDSKERGQFNAD
jgi:hypothetical protein